MAVFFITFRETLEAGLVIGIVLDYLLRTGQRQYIWAVWWGTGIGLGISAIVGILLFLFAGRLVGTDESFFEASTMLIAAVLLATMLVWMHKQRDYAKKVEAKVKAYAQKKYSFGIFILVFLSVVREGVEASIFLFTAASLAQVGSVVSALLGVFGAAAIVVLFFTVWRKISLKTFFRTSTIILSIFAAGLLAQGVHEFIDIGWVPALINHLYNVNAVISENGIVGGLLKALLGYNGSPTLMEVLVWWTGVITLSIFLRQRPKTAIVR